MNDHTRAGKDSNEGGGLIYTGMDARLADLARFLIRHRKGALVLQLLVFVACLWAIAGMRLYDDPNAWPPKSDPFVQLNRVISDHFGGGNSVSIEFSVKDGTIFTAENLKTIKNVNDSLYNITGVIPYAVRSIAALEAKHFLFLGAGTPDEEMVIAPLMSDYPHTDKEVKDVEEGAVANPMVYGTLVSKDKKSALILADFRSEAPPGSKLATTEPVAIYHAISAVIKANQRDGITLRAAGTPIIVGWVNSDGLLYVLIAFGFFLLIIGLTLLYGFRTFSGIFLPMRVALLGALMGFGLYRLFFGATLYSAAALLAPFIVVAAGACHSVQFLTRFFFEEYPRLGDVEDAIISTFVSRLRPMLVSLLCDVVPFAIMALIPFENVRALGLVTGLGLASLTFDEFVMMIPALSSITIRELESEHFHTGTNEGASATDIWLEKLIRSIVDRPAIGVGILVLTVTVTAFLGRNIANTPVGQNNTYAIHNYLTRSWNRSALYHMEREISARFGGVYPMTVLIQGKPGVRKSLEDPAVMGAIDKFAKFLRGRDNVGYVADPALDLTGRYEFVHSLDPAYDHVPRTKQEIGEGLESFEAITPGAYDWLFSEDYNSCVVTAYCASTDPRKVGDLIAATQKEADLLFGNLPVTVGIAGGAVGIAEAFNRNIRYYLIVGALLGFLGTFILSIPFIRSILLPALLIVPLILGTIAALGLMITCGIELNSNATAALAIASGVGIDSEVYLLYRVREEYLRLHNFREALVQGYVKIRRALLVSNGALILGCWVLAPIPLYIGYVGFGMGLVLAMCFITSAVVSPIVWSWFGGSTIIGSADTAAQPEEDQLTPIRTAEGH
jgi:predicted RND superfamily exporter protein